MKPKTSHWEDSSNGWFCYACKRDSPSAYEFCPFCNRKMRNGYIDMKEDVFTRKEELSKEESEWLIDFITKEDNTE